MEELFEKWKNKQPNGVSEEEFFKRVIDPLNKMIRKYSGDNTFISSLQKNLRNSRNYFESGNKRYKVLSDKQYKVAIDILNFEL